MELGLIMCSEFGVLIVKDYFYLIVFALDEAKDTVSFFFLLSI